MLGVLLVYYRSTYSAKTLRVASTRIWTTKAEDFPQVTLILAISIVSSHPKEDYIEPSFRDKIRDDCQVAATGNVSTIFLPRQEQVLQTTHGVSQSGTTSKEGNACRPITFIAAQVRLWRKMDISVKNFCRMQDLHDKESNTRLKLPTA